MRFLFPASSAHSYPLLSRTRTCTTVSTPSSDSHSSAQRRRGLLDDGVIADPFREIASLTSPRLPVLSCRPLSRSLFPALPPRPTRTLSRSSRHFHLRRRWTSLPTNFYPPVALPGTLYIPVVRNRTVADPAEFAKLKEGVEHSEEPESHRDEFDEAKRHAEARELAESQAQLKAKAQRELLKETERVHHVEGKVAEGAEEVKEAVVDEAKEVKQKGKEVADKVEKKGAEVKAEVKEKYEEGKEYAAEKYAQGTKEAKEKYAEGKKEAKELAAKAEQEIKKDVRYFFFFPPPRSDSTDTFFRSRRPRSFSARLPRSRRRVVLSPSSTPTPPPVSSVSVRLPLPPPLPS